MFGLIAALFGVSLATSGIFLFFNNRRLSNLGTVRKRMQRELLAASLLVSGGAILLVTVTLIEKHQPGAELAISPNELIEQNPPAAGRAVSANTQQAKLQQTKIAVLAWGTPSDNDAVGTQEVSIYSRQLSALAQGMLSLYAPQADIAIHDLSRDDFTRLTQSSTAFAEWCERYDGGFLLALGVGATKMENGDYALWREPVYQTLDCRNAKAQRMSSRITEKAGDRFPYQIAISDDLRRLLDQVIAAN